MTTVESIETRLVELPLPKPVGTSIHSMRSVGCVLVDVRCDDGVVGQSYIFSLNGARLRSLDEMVKGLSDFVLGRDVHETGAVFADIWKAINPMGYAGVTVSALSAIDVALWDAVGKVHDTALHRLWGSCRDTVATYATSGLWLSQSTDELLDDAQRFIDDGFTAIKMRVGGSQSSDVERVSAVRDAIGPDIELLVDVNQSLEPKQAIQLGRALEPFAIGWFEEPVPSYDLVGHARVRDALDVAVASGESVYSRFGMQALIDAGAADILMPDLQRIGGYSEFRRSSAAASAVNLPISSHFFTEQSLCLAGAIDNHISVEHCDWFSALFNEGMELINGELVIPDRSGHGFTFNEDAVARYAI